MEQAKWWEIAEKCQNHSVYAAKVTEKMTTRIVKNKEIVIGNVQITTLVGLTVEAGRDARCIRNCGDQA